MVMDLHLSVLRIYWNMNNILEKNLCNGCSACALVCPKNCISMLSDDEGFLYPKIDKSLCINCGLCDKVCPVLTPQIIKQNKSNIKAYAVTNKLNDVVLKSSSGGVFNAIATYVIRNGGVVVGAGFDDNFFVKHKCVSDIKDLYELQGSKYVQSNIGNTYKEIKKLLDDGILVYFSGTPCQVGGLVSFVGKKYNNLITQDLICHGVPSPLVWKKYLEYIKSKHKAKIKSIFFRDKTKGWKTFSMKITFEDGAVYRQTLKKNPYLRAFLKNLCLRPSCYDCSFKRLERVADITLADFWGVEKILPEYSVSDGVSLVLIHTEKGKELFENLGDDLNYITVNLEKSIKGNSSVNNSAAKPIERDAFMKIIKEQKFVAVKKYYKDSVFKKISNFMLKVKNKLLRSKK